MNNLSEKFTQKDFKLLNEKLNAATCQINEIQHIANKLGESDVYKILIAFDGISRTAGMLNSICNQLLDDNFITTSDPMSYIHGKSELSFEFLDDLCEKYTLQKYHN